MNVPLLLTSLLLTGRSSKIQTCDLSDPNRARYQTAPCSDLKKKIIDLKGEGQQDYGILQEDEKVGLKKVDDRGNNTPLENVGFVFSAQVQSYDLVKSIEHYHWVTKSEMSPLFRLLILAPMLPKSNSPEDYDNSESS